MVQYLNSMTLLLQVWGYFCMIWLWNDQKTSLAKSSHIWRQIFFDTKTIGNHSKGKSLHTSRHVRRVGARTCEEIWGRNWGARILRKYFLGNGCSELPLEEVCVVLSCSASGACLWGGRLLEWWSLWITILVVIMITLVLIIMETLVSIKSTSSSFLLTSLIGFDN